MKTTSITQYILASWLALWLSFPVLAYESEFLSVQTTGTGPDIILIHGFASSPDVWEALTERLQPNFRFHLVKMNGFAGSTAPQKQPQSYLNTLRDEISQYIKHQALDKPTLIGHSMGGLLALLIAENDTPIEKVIIIDALPFYSLLFDPHATTTTVRPQAESMEKHLLTLNDQQFEQQAQAAIAFLTKEDEKKALLLEWTKNTDRKIYARYLKEAISHDARPALKNIACPVTVIYAYDPAMRIPPERLNQLYARAYSPLKKLEIHVIPDSYHFIMWDQPEQLASQIQRTLTNP